MASIADATTEPDPGAGLPLRPQFLRSPELHCFDHCEGLIADQAQIGQAFHELLEDDLQFEAGQWRTGKEIAALEQGGANRVTIWINALKTEETLTELESLASELL